MSARAQPEKKSKHSSWKDDYNKDPKHKWKGRAGKAVRAREEAKRPGFERGRELMVAEVAKMMAPVIIRNPAMRARRDKSGACVWCGGAVQRGGRWLRRAHAIQLAALIEMSLRSPNSLV